MLTRFELSYLRRHHTKRMGDKGNRENCGGCGGRDHTFVQHTAPSDTVFVPGLNGRISYHIKCFNCDKWIHYENQCPEPTQEGTPNKSGKIWHKSAGASHKTVVAMQSETTGSYFTCVPLSAASKQLNRLKLHRESIVINRWWRYNC